MNSEIPSTDTYSHCGLSPTITKPLKWEEAQEEEAICLRWPVVLIPPSQTMENLQYPGFHKNCLMHLKGQKTFLPPQISLRVVYPTKRFRKSPWAWHTDQPHVVHFYSKLLSPYLASCSDCCTFNLNLNSISSKRAHSLLHSNILHLHPVLGPTVWKICNSLEAHLN